MFCSRAAKLYGVVFLCFVLCIGGMHFKCSSTEVGPYADDTPLREADLSFLDDISPGSGSTFAIDFAVLPIGECRWYTRPDESLEVAYVLPEGSVTPVRSVERLSGLVTLPAEKPGWRYTTVPLLTRGEADEFTGARGAYYIKTSDFLIMAEDAFKFWTHRDGSNNPLRYDPFYYDRLLYQSGVYLSPDLPEYRFAAIGAAYSLCAALWFAVRTARQRRVVKFRCKPAFRR